VFYRARALTRSGANGLQVFIRVDSRDGRASSFLISSLGVLGGCSVLLFLSAHLLKMAAKRCSVQVNMFLLGLRVSQPLRRIAPLFDNSLIIKPAGRRRLNATGAESMRAVSHG
jgi:hypothetical protein